MTNKGLSDKVTDFLIMKDRIRERMISVGCKPTDIDIQLESIDSIVSDAIQSAKNLLVSAGRFTEIGRDSAKKQQGS